MSITIFEIIHQGPQDTIFFRIQNKKVGVNGENFFNVIPMEPHSESAKIPDFLKKKNLYLNRDINRYMFILNIDVPNFN